MRVILFGLVCLIVFLLLTLAPLWLRAVFAAQAKTPFPHAAPPTESDNVIEGEFRRIDSPS